MIRFTYIFIIFFNLIFFGCDKKPTIRPESQLDDSNILGTYMGSFHYHHTTTNPYGEITYDTQPINEFSLDSGYHVMITKSGDNKNIISFDNSFKITMPDLDCYISEATYYPGNIYVGGAGYRRAIKIIDNQPYTNVSQYNAGSLKLHQEFQENPEYISLDIIIKSNDHDTTHFLIISAKKDL